MIFYKSSLKAFRAISGVYIKNNVNTILLNNNIRLFSKEIEISSMSNKIKSVRQLQNKKTRKVTGIAIVVAVIPLASFGLGIWQILRKIEKENLIESLKKRTILEPVDLPEDLTLLEKMEYQPVKVKGVFDHSKELYMGPRSIISTGTDGSKALVLTSDPGYLVITPFTLSDRNLTILVNRGWVHNKKKLPHTRLEGQITGEVELVGLVRHSEPRKPLGMKNIPEKNFWLYRDLKKLSEATGAAPIMIDAVKSSTVPGGPIGGQTLVRLRNEHFAYIVTWFMLGLITSVMWYSRYIKPV